MIRSCDERHLAYTSSASDGMVCLEVRIRLLENQARQKGYGGRIKVGRNLVLLRAKWWLAASERFRFLVDSGRRLFLKSEVEPDVRQPLGEHFAR
jgi:hypothetical protein